MGIFTRIKRNPDRQLIVERVQDVEPIIERNKAQMNGHNGEVRKFKGDFHHVARIPMVLIEKWRNEEGIDYFNRNDWPKIVAKLNDPEYSYLRTRPGRL